MKQNFLPKYLLEKKNVVSLVVTTAFFAEFFILIFRPFGSVNWLNGVSIQWKDWIFLGVSMLCVLVAMILIAISRCVLYKRAKKHKIPYWQYGIVLLCEVASMALVYSLVAFFAYFVPHNEPISFFNVFIRSLGCTFCILSIPYIILHLAFALVAANDRLAELYVEKEVAEDKPNRVPTQAYHFRDDKKELKLAILAEDLYYVESADNYIVIHYRIGDRLQKTSIRKTMKNLEEEFKNTDLIRCHRSYMVNFQKIRSIQKTEDGFVVVFGEMGLPNLPISKTYSPLIMHRL